MTQEDMELIRAMIREETETALQNTVVVGSPLRVWAKLRKEIERVLRAEGYTPNTTMYGTLNNIGYLLAKRYGHQSVTQITDEEAADVRQTIRPFLDFIINKKVGVSNG